MNKIKVRTHTVVSPYPKHKIPSSFEVTGDIFSYFDTFAINNYLNNRNKKYYIQTRGGIEPTILDRKARVANKPKVKHLFMSNQITLLFSQHK